MRLGGLDYQPLYQLEIYHYPQDDVSAMITFVSPR